MSKIKGERVLGVMLSQLGKLGEPSSKFKV